MRLDKLWIRNFKNLKNTKIDFDENELTTVLLGKNASAKSNLIEALVLIFRNLDLSEDPPFSYEISYECRGRVACNLAWAVPMRNRQREKNRCHKKSEQQKRRSKK